MPVVVIIIAAGLIAAGIRGTYRDLGNLIVSEWTGPGNFFTWIIAIGCIGVLGYVPALQRFSRVFLALVIVAMFVKQQKGLFANFTGALQGATAGQPVTPPGKTIDAGQAANDGSLSLENLFNSATNLNPAGISNAVGGAVKSAGSSILGGISSFGSGLDFGAPGIN